MAEVFGNVSSGEAGRVEGGCDGLAQPVQFEV
jgi:hypothetical protein